MDVRDLITELLDYNMEAEVNVEISGEEFDFSLESPRWTKGDQVIIKSSADNYTVIDSRDFENMENRIEELENEIAELRQD